MDWSSLAKDSPVYRTVVRSDAERIMVEFLARRTKNQPTLLKVNYVFSYNSPYEPITDPSHTFISCNNSLSRVSVYRMKLEEVF